MFRQISRVVKAKGPEHQLFGWPDYATFEITPWKPLDVNEPSRTKRAKQRTYVLELAARLIAER